MQQRQNGHISVVGGGLAGCEAALWLAGRGFAVRLYEQKPKRMSPAHKSPLLAELVCSNSLKASRVESAAGLLKAEMRLLGSRLLPLADACQVPAGGALAVDRGQFAALVTAQVQNQALIELVEAEVEGLEPLLEDGPVIVASGPLTDGALAADIERLAGARALSFYDAAAPIVAAHSLDREKVFAAARYGRGEADYLNCPFDKEGYERFYAALVTARRAELHAFDGPLAVYEGCMPVEEMARRGPDTLRYGPLRPVGLTNPRTGHRPWANVQLRKENTGGSLYNLVGFQTNLAFSEQKRVFSLIPGLEEAEFVRYGVMHRNSFLNAPAVLMPNFGLRGRAGLYFAGQITGLEGYMESAMGGLLAARALAAGLLGKNDTPPPALTICGGLCRYMTAPNPNYQPMGANMGLLPGLASPIKGKQQRYAALAQRALAAMQSWLAEDAI